VNFYNVSQPREWQGRLLPDRVDNPANTALKRPGCPHYLGQSEFGEQSVMPLSTSAEREHIHTRRVICEGFRRKDGLWDIEAYLEDTKTYGFDNEHRGGRIEPGEPVHGLRVRVTLDLDFKIHAVDAASDFTPFGVCTNATEPMKEIVGLSIGPGWMRKVKERVGMRNSCTHLVEMLSHIATTAYQTMHYAIEERAQSEEQRSKPRILDTCVALATDSPVVKKNWPEFYTGEMLKK
jgi:hypothetical protein